jgi:L-threonylcarbamoyladenylate synthase
MSVPPILPIHDRAAVAAAVGAIRGGRIIAYPTDTVYGVGGDALLGQAARDVRRAKGRDDGKGFPVLLAAARDVWRLAAEWPPAAAALAGRFWPGALTIVVAARPEVPVETCAGTTVALRVPALTALRLVIEASGVPLIGTSANRSGQPPALTAAAAAAALGDSVALVLDGSVADGEPSTVVAVDERHARLLRPGAISRTVLAAALAPLGMHLEG